MSGFKRANQRQNLDNTLDREIEFHIDELAKEYVKEGLSPEEARRRALIEFGGREQTRQQVREVHSSQFRESIGCNFKAILRFLRKAPTFSAAVILILALGIGANSAVFSAIDAIVLRPLPYPGGDALMAVEQHNSNARNANRFVAPRRLEDWNGMNSTFQAITGYYFDDLSETSGALPERVTECLVAPRFLEVFGVSPTLGRVFATSEEHWGGPSVVLISYSYWQRRFHGDPSVIGQKVHLDGRSSSVIGVMPDSFRFPNRDVDMWAPSAPDAPFAQRRDANWFSVAGRLKPNTTSRQASADLASVQNRLGKQFGKPDSELTVEVTPLKDTIVGATRDSLWFLYLSVTLLLLIACSNIAALLLARTAEREHEIAIRFSLGASRKAIFAQLLSEVFALALIGSLVGLLIAAFAIRELHIFTKALPRAQEIALNWRIVLYALFAALATTLICGLVPALKGVRNQLAHSMATAGRTQASTRRPLQWLLVGVQVTLAVTLLIAAGLLLRSFQELRHVSPGFEPSNVLTFQVSGSWGETRDTKNVAQRINRTLDQLRSLPGVEDAATAAMLPGVPAHYQLGLKIDSKTQTEQPILADVRYVSAGYFHTVGISLLIGNSCRQASTIPEVLVNQSFSDRYFEGNSPIGHVLAGAAPNDFLGVSTIRGVVADAREEGINARPIPTAYFCTPAPSPFPNYLVRTQGDPLAMAESIRLRIHQFEPARSVYGFSTLQSHLDDQSSENRLRTTLLALFAATATSLACIGLYGTLTYLGRLRRREVGVRLAFGALPSQIAGRFILQGVRITAAGCLLGMALGYALTRLLSGMLYDVSVVDPTTYIGVVALVLSVAFFASLAPALRAARTEPLRALRDE